MAGRSLGYGLLAGAGLLALLMIAWLAVSGAQGGGIVLGLILLVVLAGPLAVAGVVVLSRQSGEAAAEAAFASKRRILDADRLFRRELAPELRQLARQPGLPEPRLTDLAEDLERSTYDSAEWYDAVQLSDDDAQTLKRYDDLVWERVRLLRASASGEDSQQQVRELEEALDQRRDLLVRGRRAPAAPPSVLLRSGSPARGLDALSNLALGDAVTIDSHDYLVEGVASYFDQGQTSKLVHLVPAGTDSAPRWLYIGPAGLDIGLLEEAPNPGDLPRTASGTATVDVDSQSGSARGVLVSITRYADDSALGLVEQWPDGTRHTYSGRRAKASDIEVWPAKAINC
jgi:hypothetical protein